MTDMPAMTREQLEAMCRWLEGKADEAGENKLKKPPGDPGWWPMRQADKYEQDLMWEIARHLRKLQRLYPAADGGIGTEGMAQLPANLAWRLRDNERLRRTMRSEYQEAYYAEHVALRRIAEALGKLLDHPFDLPQLTPEELVEAAVQSTYVMFRPEYDDAEVDFRVEETRRLATRHWTGTPAG